MLETIDILSSIQKLQLEMEIVGKIKSNLNPKQEQPHGKKMLA